MSKITETHFTRLARRGLGGPGASGGEKRAGRLAREVVESAAGLDCAAIAGLYDFINECVQNPMAAQEWLEQMPQRYAE